MSQNIRHWEMQISEVLFWSNLFDTLIPRLDTTQQKCRLSNRMLYSGWTISVAVILLVFDKHLHESRTTIFAGIFLTNFDFHLMVNWIVTVLVCIVSNPFTSSWKVKFAPLRWLSVQTTPFMTMSKSLTKFETHTCFPSPTTSNLGEIA